MLSQLELKELEQFFTKQPKDPKELMAHLTRQPELIHFVKQRTLDKFNVVQALQTIKNDFSATRIWEHSKKPFIKAVAEYLRYTEYKPAIELTKQMIPDLMSMGLILERPFDRPIFKVNETIAKQMIKAFGSSSDLWRRLNTQIPYHYLLKHYKLNLWAINYIKPKDLTKEMIKYCQENEKHISHDLLKPTLDNRKIWTRELVVNAIKLGNIPSNLLTKSYLPDFNISLITALYDYINYGRIMNEHIFDDTDKTYFDLVGLDNKETIIDYIADKVLKTPAEQV